MDWADEKARVMMETYRHILNPESKPILDVALESAFAQALRDAYIEGIRQGYAQYLPVVTVCDATTTRDKP